MQEVQVHLPAHSTCLCCSQSLSQRCPWAHGLSLEGRPPSVAGVGDRRALISGIPALGAPLDV